jgi:hypothetical protein
MACHLSIVDEIAPSLPLSLSDYIPFFVLPSKTRPKPPHPTYWCVAGFDTAVWHTGTVRDYNTVRYERRMHPRAEQNGVKAKHCMLGRGDEVSAGEVDLICHLNGRS